jgi:hypothetical protein
MTGPEETGRNWRLLLGTTLIGVLLGGILFLGFLAGGWSARSASELSFSLAGLPFSVGLIGWSTVLLSGNAMEGFSKELGLSSGWTAEGGRQAMALLIAIGGGGMLGSSIAASPFGV